MTYQPLPRIILPNISTLISNESTGATGKLGMTNIETLIGSQTQNLVARPITLEEQTIGITIDTGVTENTGTTSGVVSGQTVGRQLPRTFSEVRDVLSLVTPGRAGKRSKVYDLVELKKIAQNLSLPTGGNKASLANSITQAVVAYFGGQ